MIQKLKKRIHHKLYCNEQPIEKDRKKNQNLFEIEGTAKKARDTRQSHKYTNIVSESMKLIFTTMYVGTGNFFKNLIFK